MKILAVLISIVISLLAGCAQMVWNKPNAQQGEFERTRYTCLRQSQQYQSGVGMVTPNTLTGGFTVIDTSGMETNTNLFNACMQANGWNLQRLNQEGGSSGYQPQTPDQGFTNPVMSSQQSELIKKRDAQRAKCDLIKDNDAFLACMRSAR